MSKLREAIPASNLEAGYADFTHQYMAAYGHLGPWVSVVPLEDTAFNRAKSNLAWIEATCAGALTLAPMWPDWLKPGVFTYDGLKGGLKPFDSALRVILSKFEDAEFQARVQASRDYIRENLLLDTVNARRWEIVNRLARQESGVVK